MSELNHRQKQFCQYYILNPNAKQAAVEAGYSERTAQSIGVENLRKPKVQEYLAELMKAKEDELIANQDEVLQTLTRVLRRQETETVVITVKSRRSYFDSNGKKVIEEQEEPQLVEIPTKISDVNKAAELLGKRYSLYTDKVDMKGAAPIVLGGYIEVED